VDDGRHLLDSVSLMNKSLFPNWGSRLQQKLGNNNNNANLQSSKQLLTLAQTHYLVIGYSVSRLWREPEGECRNEG